MASGASKKLAFIGLGSMGSRLAGRVAMQNAVHVYDLNPTAISSHNEEFGSVPALDIPSALAGADMVVTCLPRSKNIDQILDVTDDASVQLGNEAIWIDCTSGDPKSTRALADRLDQTHSCQLIDCAVSGGPRWASEGKLTAMCGGSEPTFERARSVIESFAENIQLLGPVGSGHALKAVNNALMAAHIWLASEALVGLTKAGICPEKACRTISKSSGRSWAFKQRFPDHVLTRTFDYGFSLELLAKVETRACIEYVRQPGSDRLVGLR